jgi:cell wall-associated NlpC family hydrolase
VRVRTGAARVAATAGVVGLACMLGGRGAWADSTTGTTGGTSGGTTGGPASEASLQIQAQELAGQIAAEGRTLDELDASYNAAQLRYQGLQTQISALKADITKTAAEVTASRNALRSQAVLAYVAGGAQIVAYHPDQPGEDRSLATSYAEIVAGGEKRAEATYRSTLATQSAQAAQLSATSQQAAIALSDIHSNVAQATATLAARRQVLARVTGQLAVLVAQVQQSQQQAEAQAVQTQLASQGDLPPSTPTAPTAPAPTAASPTSPSTTPLRQSQPTPTTRTVATTRPTQTTDTTRPAPPPTPTTTAPPAPSGNVPARGANIAISYAEAQLGKPYQWGGAGPNSFDCSGLVMMAWAQAGVYFPHLAQDQYNMTRRIPLADLLPGDLVFFGTPDNVYHVGIYIGNGQMIDAPETGQDVSIQSIYWSSLLGGGRVQN